MPRGESAPDLCLAFRAPVQGSAEVAAARSLKQRGEGMTEQRWYAGVDWASESHHVFLTDGAGRKIGEKIFKHSGEGLAEMAAWLLTASGAASSSQIYVAIEVPHGPVVETLIERGLTIHAINPKQMDRFRDRFTLAGAKDDSRDAEVMASPCGPIRIACGCWPPSTQPSSNCASGRASQAILARSVTGSPTACASSFGATFPPCWSSKAILAPHGCSTCGKSHPHPARPRASARGR